MILLDTNTLSEAFRAEGTEPVKAWLAQLDRATTFMSAVSIHEIAQGIARLVPSRKKSNYADWLHETKLLYANRILPIDAQVAELCGERKGEMMRGGVNYSLADGLIAATARVHNLRVATRNVRDMLAAGASVYDPWTAQMHEPAP